MKDDLLKNRKETQSFIARELGISKSYLSYILRGKKGCSENLMIKIKKYYPELKFYNFTKPRYKVEVITNEI